MEFRRKIWRRGGNSWATTVPKEILAIKDVPVENGGVETVWSIDAETGTVEVEFQEADDEDE